jgi:DNA-directed RNA polymerase specialized sigma24 family protein
LRYAEDMNVSQIAQVLGKTRTHVKVLLFRARQTLASELEGNPSSSKAAVSSRSVARRIPLIVKSCL